MTENTCLFSVPAYTLSSVAQAGQPQGWPVAKGPEFQTCLGHHPSLEPGVVKSTLPLGTSLMNDSHQDTLPSSITLFCRLVSTFDLSALSDIDLADLNALSAGGIEGLCHGLLFISDSLE
ncbi:TPA: hypothetical protein ACG0BA_002981 [Serratia odorifera]